MPKVNPTWNHFPAGLDTVCLAIPPVALKTITSLYNSIETRRGTATQPQVLAVNGFTRPARNSVGTKRPDPYTNHLDPVSLLNYPIKCARTCMESISIAQLLTRILTERMYYMADLHLKSIMFTSLMA